MKNEIKELLENKFLSHDRDSLLIEMATEHAISLSTASRLYTEWGKTHDKPSMSSQLVDWFIDNSESSDQQIEEKSLALGFSKSSVRYYIQVLSLAKQISQQLDRKKQTQRFDN